MRNKSKIILIVFISLLIVSGFIYYTQYNNYYESGEVVHLYIDKGENFTIRMHGNSSTGFRDCWINENKCNSVKLFEQNYTRLGFADGSGGISSWTFTGISKGHDTIKINICPVGYLGKDCSFFSEDSITLHLKDSIDMAGSRLPYTSFLNVDYTFVIEVAE